MLLNCETMNHALVDRRRECIHDAEQMQNMPSIQKQEVPDEGQ